MEKDAAKKLGAIGSAVVVILLFASLPVSYYLLDAPLVAVAVMAVVFLVVSILLVYCVVQRFRELDGGLEDDIEHY